MVLFADVPVKDNWAARASYLPLNAIPYLLHGVLTSAAGSETIRVRFKPGFPLRFKGLLDDGLHDTVFHRWYAQRALATAALWDKYPLSRARLVIAEVEVFFLAPLPPRLRRQV